MVGSAPASTEPTVAHFSSWQPTLPLELLAQTETEPVSFSGCAERAAADAQAVLTWSPVGCTLGGALGGR